MTKINRISLEFYLKNILYLFKILHDLTSYWVIDLTSYMHGLCALTQFKDHTLSVRMPEKPTVLRACTIYVPLRKSF